MYPWVSHTHSHLGGECPHRCSYCYVDAFRMRSAKYQGPLRLIEKELEVIYGKGKTIFIENCNDLFAESIPLSMSERIIAHCIKYPGNTYVFQTKNPARYREIRAFPENTIFGCTIESNRHYPHISHAPQPSERFEVMELLRYLDYRTFVTIEPILGFDVDVLASWIIRIRPEFVNIGADSKGRKLPEPPYEKVLALIDILKRYGIEVREKRNLDRLKARQS